MVFLPVCFDSAGRVMTGTPTDKIPFSSMKRPWASKTSPILSATGNVGYLFQSIGSSDEFCSRLVASTTLRIPSALGWLG